MKNLKKVLSFVLVLAMCLSLGVSAYAAPGKGNSGRIQPGYSKPQDAPADEPAEIAGEIELEEPAVVPEEPAEEPVSEEVKTFTFEDGDMSVFVDAPKDAFPEGTRMKVSQIPLDEVQEKIDVSDYAGRLAAVAVDISFENGAGAEVQPAVPVNVSITSNEVPAGSDPAVLHIGDDGSVTEVTDASVVVSASEKAETFRSGAASITNDSTGVVEVAEEETAVEAVSISFVATSFSTYTLTWRSGNQNRSATVHIGYLSNNSNTFNEFAQVEAELDDSGDEIDLKAFVESVFPDYAYIGARYSASATTGNTNELGSHILTKQADGTWQTLEVYGNDFVTRDLTIANNSHIYIFCEEKGAGSYTPPTPEGSSVNPSTVAPNFAKTVTANTDGTYTIKLDITGHQAPVQEGQGANVIVVLDTTKSMRYNMAGTDPGSYDPNSTTTRMYAAKAALRTLVNTLKPGDGTGDTNLVNIAFIEFNNSNNTPTAHTWTGGGTWTSNQNTLNSYINGLTPTTGSGTNWENGLHACENLLATIPNNANLKNNVTYVIFVTDGVPNRCEETSLGNDYRYNAAAVAHAQDNANNIANLSYLYGVFCGASAGLEKLETLIDVASGKSTIEATSQTALEAAFQNIGEIITSALGSHNVNMDDGVPSLASIQQNVAGDAADFTYYKDDVVWTTAQGAPEATYDPNNGVVWDLSSIGTLGDTKYSIEFTIWPTQASYDLIADLNNGLKDFDDLPESQKACVTGSKETGYTLATNTHLSASYVNEADGKTYPVDAVPYEGKEMPLPTKTISVKKIWPANMLDEYGAAAYRDPTTGKTMYAEQIELTLQREVDGVREDYLDIVVSKDGKDGRQDGTYIDEETGEQINAADDNWMVDDIYVSCGFMTVKNGVVDIKEPGHDYQIVEPPEFLYYWDLISDVYHPMVINGTSTVLVYDPDITAADVPNGIYEIPANSGRYYKTQADTSGNTLEASNYRRSNLNLYKVIENENEEAFFTYTATVKDSYTTDGYVWFSAFEPVRDENGDPVYNDDGNIKSQVVYEDWVLSGATAETSTLRVGEGAASNVQYHEADDTHSYPYFSYVWNGGSTYEVPAVNSDVSAPVYYTGYYYATNGATVTFKIKAGWEDMSEKGWDSFPGWNVRFLNLYHGSTFSFDETGMPGNYYFDEVTATTQWTIEHSSNADWYTIDAESTTGLITGKITEPNNNYNIGYSNKVRPEFYIYHSSVAGDGGLETIPMSAVNDDGTYNLYAKTKEGTLYGGYYLDYAGKGDYKDDGVKGTTGVAYTGMNVDWDWDDAQTVDGKKMKPVAGETYYIKEVPTYYIRNYHQIVYVKDGGKLMNLFLISAIDDLNYTDTGFVLQTNDGKQATVVSAMTYKNWATGKSVTLKANTIFKKVDSKAAITEEGEYLTYFDATSSDYFAEGTFTVVPYWKTPDGISVNGISTRTITIESMTKSGISKTDS